MANEEPASVAADVKSDCYSARERAVMVLTQQFRGWLFGPLLRLLARCGIKPDHLTLLSTLVGLSFCPLFLWSKPFAFAMLALHVLLDGLDGPLARSMGVASRKGSFTDTMSDQLIVVASTVTLMFTETIGIVPGGVYIFAYTVVVLFAMVRNALSIPYSWLVRPRFVLYVWFVVETYHFPGTINYVLWFFNILLAVKMLTGFIKIRKRI